MLSFHLQSLSHLLYRAHVRLGFKIRFETFFRRYRFFISFQSSPVKRKIRTCLKSFKNSEMN
ncbi:hypothetical protein LEP1GSC036_2815 [Leptospira weilii str. 2006001853]|uniref:Uncharacterized protein n=2 Tax=Leptospira weilii TaxID=28184 RepID=A0A828Z711_9LEPT|nr:hypothetical protein LEP1GSC036_2815 [Leptospira weilii str. 2006001853]EMN44047.1 hypothetical protein LEP1GSC086_4313 [Leptospira weilii str. LNT 1234]EMN88524.1 hypothetical protein LEP1GSC108_2143 [Leptospira weilii str. UI 13098]OMI19225.1 hypothetical protein BUQ74_00150 [Leptospira weilii serovar Heyan]QDK22834.1 hypothetical protein FHG67_09005 [Leptospira weilii]